MGYRRSAIPATGYGDKKRLFGRRCVAKVMNQVMTVDVSYRRAEHDR